MSNAEETFGSVLRLDQMTGTWVVFAAGRANRPKQVKSGETKVKLADLEEKVDNCPFCAGNEHMLERIVMKFDCSDGDCVRVVPNKYPAVEPMTNKPRKSSFQADKVADLHRETPAVGFHEVVIESSKHNGHIASSPLESTKHLLRAYRDSGRAHEEVDGIEHICYFKNHGSTAGASLVHPHAQIVSTPVVPAEAARLQALALEYFEQKGMSLYERMIEDELEIHWGDGKGSRVIECSDHFVSMVPYASPGPYVINIFPLYGPEKLKEGIDCSQFTTTPDDLIDECAMVLKKSVMRMQILLDEPCFNLVIQSSPVHSRGRQAAFNAATFFKWHIRITPRLGEGAMGGFELGSGLYNNSHMPENDAAELKAVELPAIE